MDLEVEGNEPSGEADEEYLTPDARAKHVATSEACVTADEVHGAKQGPSSEATKPSKTFISEEINTTGDQQTEEL
ncbi:hypothetical protein B9Z55_016493 [Caenorhabditis nigoni]|uniref:Uncharacterized protein n=1 Tax=Caenorhabditis nigoni TaxID=1611254 RepID=A0A2G5T5N8_9PELO|nr:hypothetical protein B9Z55_016493 [Caenorhabditis nigoni]